MTRTAFAPCASALAFAFAAALPMSAAARDACVVTDQGETACGRAASATGSIYGGYGGQVFLRGGYTFFGKDARNPNSAGMPHFSAGYRRPIFPGSRFSLEGEVLYHKDSEVAFIGVGDADVSVTGLVGLASLRWDGAEFAWGMAPFVSIGFGPGYYKYKFDDGTTAIKTSQVGLSYSGRVGVEKDLMDKLSFEAAYRYLNSTTDAGVGQHAAELGLNYAF